ncbi:substrate-binding domain-containing protein [Streptomyces sp. NBC_01264]|uniref:substrate-binding domain-containing protein n=1 Tax=Streptomyces sp. NBC_01264 TaxID=2903804 RepID=UPI00225004D3|nr:substrate-binding domain-containing protein [Streptomyces sp. NBC_01264]MCX4782453.1 substrate-binding domain-containing protein [Streptomyces sp. NBC_01264]
MRERVEERHKRALRLVREHGSVRIRDLATSLGISVETARRDVAALSDAGLVRRLHGSALWPTARLSPREARLARTAPPLAPGGLVLGMVVPAVGYFYPSVIRGARDAAADVGARLLVATTEYDRDQDRAHIETLLDAGAIGLLLTPSWGMNGPDSGDLQELADLPVPAVLVERQVPAGSPGAEIDRVGSAHADGAAAGVRHLAALGHRRVALLSRATHTAPALRQGYRAAVGSLGLPEDDLSPAEGPGPGGTDRHFERDLDRLLRLAAAGEVRAALVHPDSAAIGLLRRLTARGLRVPEDFSIVCYDDELATLADVPLTSVGPVKHAVGEAALNLLVRRMENPGAESSHVALLPRLRVRESCGAP